MNNVTFSVTLPLINNLFHCMYDVLMPCATGIISLLTKERYCIFRTLASKSLTIRVQLRNTNVPSSYLMFKLIANKIHAFSFFDG